MTLRFSQPSLHPLRLLAIAFLVFTAVRVFLFRLPDFDGAFNAQAAIRFWHDGKLLLDYRDHYGLQTHLPFQIINGLFLTLSPTFITFNIANLLFYLALFIFCDRYAQLKQRPYLYVSFILISLYPNFYTYGFSGFGELPMFICALWGASLIFERGKSFTGGMLLGCACAIKFIGFIPSATIALAKPTRSQVVRIALGFSLFFILSSWIEYRAYDSSPVHTVSSLIALQTSPVHHEKLPIAVTYGSYLERIERFIAYVIHIEGGVVVLALLALMAVVIRVWLKERLEPLDTILLSTAALFFFFYFFTSARIYERRYLCGVLSLLLVAGTLFNRSPRLIQLGITTISVLLFIRWGTQTIDAVIASRTHHIVAEEHRYREVFASLPADFKGFGISEFEAPRWSFIAQKKFSDLRKEPAFISRDTTWRCENCYLFIDRSINFDPEVVVTTLSELDYEEVYSYEYSAERILRVTGIRRST
jgi:hypothetical protein